MLPGVFRDGAAGAVRGGDVRRVVCIGEKLGVAAGLEEEDGGVRRNRAGERLACGSSRNRRRKDEQDGGEQERREPWAEMLFSWLRLLFPPERAAVCIEK